MPTDFTDYYKRVLENPTATPEAKAEARQKLNLPSSSLEGTLGGTSKKGVERTLPETRPDNLVIFRNLLRTVSERAGQEATAAGVSKLGFEPSTVSGGTLAEVVNFIKGQKTQGISDIYKSTIDLLDSQKKQAENQLQTLISTGAIANLDDASLTKLATLTDFDLGNLQQIKNTLRTKAESKLTDSGRIGQLNQFFKGKIGEDGKVSAKDYMAAYKEWIGLNGTISDFKYAYPVEEWLGEWEWKNLPQEWRPSTKITDVKSLPSEQQIFINQVQQAINNGEIKYDEAVGKYREIGVYLKPSSNEEL